VAEAPSARGIKPKDGPFEELMQDQVANFINPHSLIRGGGMGVIEARTDEEMIMQLRVVDGGGPRVAVRPVVMFGSILTEVCHHVEDGNLVS